MKKRGMSGVLAIVMLVSMLLTAIQVTGAAADGTTITLGTGATTAGSRIGFGGILWRVLKSGDSKALLISNDTLACILFHSNSNAWSSSNAKIWCSSYYTNWPEGIEKDAILATSVTETGNYTIKGGYEYGPASLNKEHFFFLSAEEADTLFTSDDDRKASGADDWWWLRSPYANSSNIAGVVVNDGGVSHNYAHGAIAYGARPAFNLSLSSVLFTSDVSISASPNTYKLTLKDTNLEIAVTDGEIVTKSGSAVIVPYTISGSDAKNTTKAYVMVTDKAYTESGAQVLQYTELTVGSNGTGTFALNNAVSSKVWGKDYRVYLLAVNEGGENKSDYASAPFALKTCELKFDANDGTGEMVSRIVEIGDTFKFPACTFGKPEGKAFIRWEMSGTDGIYLPDEEITIDENCLLNGVITISAHWDTTTKAVVKEFPKPKEPDYNGQEQPLITTGKAENGTMYYALGNNSTTAPTTGWDTAVPEAKDATAYHVWYAAVGDKGYADIAPGYLGAVIKQAPLTLKALPRTISYGDAPANNGVEYSGFVNGETEAVLGGTLVFCLNHIDNLKETENMLKPC